MKFRKKPIVIEAVQWDGDNKKEVIELILSRDQGAFTEMLECETPEDLILRTKIGVWFIKENEDIRRCTSYILKKNYEAVED